jgi:hypothetical protein
MCYEGQLTTQPRTREREREGGRERGREGGRERGREGGREREREEREREREKEREGGRDRAPVQYHRFLIKATAAQGGAGPFLWAVADLMLVPVDDESPDESHHHQLRKPRCLQPAVCFMGAVTSHQGGQGEGEVVLAGR